MFNAIPSQLIFIASGLIVITILFFGFRKLMRLIMVKTFSMAVEMAKRSPDEFKVRGIAEFAADKDKILHTFQKIQQIKAVRYVSMEPLNPTDKAEGMKTIFDLDIMEMDGTPHTYKLEVKPEGRTNRIISLKTLM